MFAAVEGENTKAKLGKLAKFIAQNMAKLGRGCGTVGRAVTSHTRRTPV